MAHLAIDHKVLEARFLLGVSPPLCVLYAADTRKAEKEREAEICVWVALRGPDGISFYKKKNILKYNRQEEKRTRHKHTAWLIVTKSSHLCNHNSGQEVACSQQP